ncbi:MAG: hypothetical protein A2X61_11070 [Ignavibacteria bacterium GWB2_35_12]|nr:MAG: hypothetical protein A2X61_11070 [Ignavibacteria bacterium GWB2_35_12]OGU87653.1 MAG: hypothetical protein A2220_12665 [Ignavibacteria bacterium RIFOXYA2_FULL_35_10]OGV24776.1 MAG: hypothetical protein A2475_14295 [Ignavibacteria bacterium RIFOXYC2_FULL_35_21]
MKSNYIIIIIIIIILSCVQLYSKKPVSIKCKNVNDTCLYESNLWIMDLNNDDRYDACIIRICSGAITGHNLLDKSSKTLTNDMTATLLGGTVEMKNFNLTIYDLATNNNICRLYYDNNLASVVLEDYTENGNNPTTYEEADNYFYTQQMGSTLLITKKAEIDVQSVLLCSLDGRIISNLQNVGGWSQFSFDMSLEPSGIYLLRFIARDRALTKRVVYLR